MAYYITYALEGHSVTGNHSTTLKLYSDDNGTPLETGELLATYSGSNSGVIVDAGGNALTRDWTDTLGNGGIQSELGNPIDVRVTDAGTGAALISFDYEGETLRFDAGALVFGDEDETALQAVYGSAEAACPQTDRNVPTADIPVYGNIELHATPTADNHVVTKEYVDAAVQSAEVGGRRETRPITGDGITKNFSIAHTLGVREVNAVVYDSNGTECVVRKVVQSSTMLLVCFNDPPEAGEEFTVLVQG